MYKLTQPKQIMNKIAPDLWLFEPLLDLLDSLSFSQMITISLISYIAAHK